MKFGVLTFSYAGSAKLAADLVRDGHVSINLGDYMQTLAARRVFRKAGVAKEDIVAIDRDTLPAYDGPPVALLMNACFFARCFPIPDAITPVFLGFQAKEAVIAANIDYLAHHAPIGCRDLATAEILTGLGVEAFVSGCATLTFGPRAAAPKDGKVFAVYGAGAGALQGAALAGMPDDLLARLEFVSQRKICHTHPLTTRDRRDAERYARFLLDRYRSEASLVVTPLHHAAAPCMASGIPVVLARRDADSRFGALGDLIPVHAPDSFDRIDWRPAPANVDAARTRYMDHARAAIAGVTGA